MERLCDLYFELSNEERLGILYRLGEGGLNVTGVARELGMTTQECSRHLSRLSGAGLVERSPEGLYGLTQYGRLSLRLVPGQRFVSEHWEYFNSHSLDGLPPEFVCRIGELEGSDPVSDVMVTFSLVESLFKGAEEYVWMIHDQYLLNILPLGVEALRRGVEFRSLEPLKKAPGRSLDYARPQYVGEEDEEYFLGAWLDGRIGARFSEAIGVYLYVSEKEAVVAFPLMDGSFDYLGFASGDETVLGFCRDLFEFFWGRGKEPSRERVEEAHERRRAYHREMKSEEFK